MTDVLSENATQNTAAAPSQSGPNLTDFVTRAANGKAADGRRDLVGLSRDQLTELLGDMGESKFRVKQMWNWIYNRGVRDIEDMTNISRKLRDRLSQDYYVGRPVLTADQKSRNRLYPRSQRRSWCGMYFISGRLYPDV